MTDTPIREVIARAIEDARLQGLGFGGQADAVRDALTTLTDDDVGAVIEEMRCVAHDLELCDCDECAANVAKADQLAQDLRAIAAMRGRGVVSEEMVLVRRDDLRVVIDHGIIGWQSGNVDPHGGFERLQAALAAKEQG